MRLAPAVASASATSASSARSPALERVGQGPAVRLPDVRPVRAQLHRHVLPDELPEEPAQRPLRRRARRRPLRSAPGDALRLGARPSPAAQRIPGGARGDRARCSPPVDRRLQGSSSWLRVVRERAGDAAMIFEDEPVPGYPLPILPGHTSPGRFERVLRAGRFAVTTELAPPDSADPEDVYRRARVFDGYVDAINATDGSGANCHMSSLAVCALLTRVGYAPVMQISCRDKNRIAIQGDILGGAAMGVCNMLCLTGDGVQAGDHPQAQPVFDLDCDVAAGDRAHAARRAPLPERPQDQLRAARAAGRGGESVRAAARVARAAAGEESRRRRAVHPDAVLLRRAAAARRSCGASRTWACSSKVFILVGVGPLRSAKAAEWMRAHVPGRAHPRRGHRAPRRAPPTRRARAATCASSSSRRCARIKGVQRRARHGLPPGRDRRRDHRPLRRARGRVPWYPGRDRAHQHQTG